MALLLQVEPMGKVSGSREPSFFDPLPEEELSGAPLVDNIDNFVRTGGLKLNCRGRYPHLLAATRMVSFLASHGFSNGAERHGIPKSEHEFPISLGNAKGWLFRE
jgi:hypothetical protein